MDIEDRFQLLWRTWMSEVTYISNPGEAARNWAAQEIVQMGPIVLPYIRSWLLLDYFHPAIFWMLSRIVGIDVAVDMRTVWEAKMVWISWIGEQPKTWQFA